MTPAEHEAIRARDRDYDDIFEEQSRMSPDIAHRLVAWPVADRRALLSAYDALRSRLAAQETATRQADERGDEAMRRAHAAEARLAEVEAARDGYGEIIEEQAARLAEAEALLREAKGTAERDLMAVGHVRIAGPERSLAMAYLQNWIARIDAFLARDSKSRQARLYHQTHEAPHCPTCDCGATATEQSNINERRLAKLRDLAGECAHCGGTGSAQQGVDPAGKPAYFPCDVCWDIRELL